MLELFVTFFKLGLFTIGGGVAMIPILSNIMVKSPSIWQLMWDSRNED